MKNLLFVVSLSMVGLLNAQTGTFTDSRDGKIYKTVVIGNQTWMAENLNVDRFRNGDVIPEAKSMREWKKADKEGRPSWCYYKNKTENGIKYGKLYNYHAILDTRGLAPVGMHIPNYKELEILLSSVKDKSGIQLKSNSGWGSYYSKEKRGLITINTSIISGNGNNNSGFTALPGGFRFLNGKFGDLEFAGLFWFSNFENLKKDNFISLSVYENKHLIGEGLTGNGLSVRCIQDIDYYLSASELYFRGEIDSAVSYLNMAAELNPFNARIYALRAKLYKEKEMLDEAISDYNNILSFDLKNESAYFERSICQSKKNNFKEAFQDINRCIELNPNNIEARCHLAYLQNQMGDMNLALVTLNELINLDPKKIEFYIYRINIYEQHQKYYEAIKDLSTIINLDSTNTEFLNRRAFNYLQINKLHEAKNDFIKSITYDSLSIYTQGQLCYVLIKLEKINEASKLINSMLLKDSGYSYAHFLLGIIYRKLKNDLRAIESFNEAIRLNPDHAESYLERGLLVRKLDKNKSLIALSDLNRAIELDSKNSSFYIERGEIREFFNMDFCIDYKKACELGNKIGCEMSITKKCSN
jgi:uncharacterized protein (TIGR02145 family)